jgi:hypothetical protein
MDKIEYRAVIKFFVKEGLTPNEIHSKFIKVYGDSSTSFSTIKKWATKFKRGCASLEDDVNVNRNVENCIKLSLSNFTDSHVVHIFKI